MFIKQRSPMKMTARFEKCCNDYRDAVNKVAIRQSSAQGKKSAGRYVPPKPG